MKTSRHITFSKLVDLAEDRGAADERAASMAHISACSSCAGELRRLEQVMGLMRTDTSLLRRVIAQLSFDSINLAPAFGVRSGQAASRQLLYSAEENDVDLRITAQDDKWVVAGQVLGQHCDGGQVEIQGEPGSAAASLNDLCEFKLPAVSPGSYTLRLRLTNLEVVVTQLELRA